MLRIMLGKDWKALRREILGRIARDVSDKKPGRVLIVPELVSHEAERALCACAGDTASRYAEVLSFTRLQRSVSDALGKASRECLDDGGRVVAMAAAARQLSSRLKAYAALESKPEFLKELVDAVDEFKRCCISPEDLKQAALSSQGAFAQKLEELALLMEGYDSLCAQGRRDPRDRMTWLLEELEDCDYGENHVFYIDGFPDFTRQNMAILEHLIRVSPLVTVALNCDSVDSPLLAFEKAGQTAGEFVRMAKRRGVEVRLEVLPDSRETLAPMRERLFQGGIPELSGENLFVYTADSPWQEVMAAAQEIDKLVRGGCRYRDISLVTTDAGAYGGLIGLIFKRMGIPCYRAGTEEILTKSVIATVLSALEAAVTGLEQRGVLRYLRSSMSLLTPDECDVVENYAYIWRVRGKDWFREWTNHPDGLAGIWDDNSRETLENLNALRQKAMAPLERLTQGFLEARDLRDQVMAVYAFLRDISLERRLKEMADELDEAGDNRGAQILNQMWEILLSALEQMHDVLGQTHWEPEHFLRLFRLLLSRYNVGTIPPVLDAVQVGPVSALRCHECRHLLLLGAQEGSLPGYSGSRGVLTDQERVTLRKLGVPLTGGAMEGIQEEFAEIYGVFCGASQSVRVYCSGEQTSYLFRRLGQMAGEIRAVQDGLEFAGANAREAGAWLARWRQEDAARELGLTDAYQDTASQADYRLGGIRPETVKALYGERLELSASQVDTQAECRLLYFLKYGLRAKERKEAEVDPAEFGTYVHSVLENTGRKVMELGGFHQVSLEKTLELAREYSDAYARERFQGVDSKRSQSLFRRNLQELDMIVEELWKELSQSAFAPVGFEVAFGKDGKMPAITIPGGKMEARLRGFVDRVDTWQEGSGSFVRVTDYKTGQKSFDYCDVSQGVGLQMLLYLFALEKEGSVLLGSDAACAGVEYFPARAPYLPADGPMTAEEIQKERGKKWVRSGLFLREERVLEAMEPENPETRLPVNRKKDGSLSGSLASTAQFRALEGYVFHLLADMVSEIASGNVSPNPYSRGSSFDVCRFCPYGSICHPDDNAQRRNFRALKAQEFWDLVEKEGTVHG